MPKAGWTKANPEKARDYKRRERQTKYRLRPGEFEQMLDFQGGKCHICKTDKPGGRGTWHIDHCHRTNLVRALLCARCNLMLGYGKDDPRVLRAAAQYLERWYSTF